MFGRRTQDPSAQRAPVEAPVPKPVAAPAATPAPEKPPEVKKTEVAAPANGGGGGGAGRWLLGGGGGAGGRDGLAMGDIPLVLAPEKQMPVTDRLKG